MSKKFRTIGLAVAALAASLAAGAQPSVPAPGGQGAPVAQPTYSSAFEGYKSFSANEVGDWRKANETAREIGGWRAYAREIQGGSTQGGSHEGHSAPSARPAAPPPAPAAPGAQGAQGAAPAAAARPAAPAPSTPPADPHQGHHQ